MLCETKVNTGALGHNMERGPSTKKQVTSGYVTHLFWSTLFSLFLSLVSIRDLHSFSYCNFYFPLPSPVGTLLLGPKAVATPTNLGATLMNLCCVKGCRCLSDCLKIKGQSDNYRFTLMATQHCNCRHRPDNNVADFLVIWLLER